MNDKSNTDIDLYILNVCNLLPSIALNKEILIHILKYFYNEGWYISEVVSYMLCCKEVSPHLNGDYACSRLPEIGGQVSKRLRNKSNGL